MHAKARPEDLARLDRAFASPPLVSNEADGRPGLTELSEGA